MPAATVVEVRSDSVSTFVIGISGGSGSGKSRLATELAARLSPARVSILPFDAYYRDLQDIPLAERALVNFDHPDSLDVEMFASHLDGLANGLDICLPVYDFTEYRRVDDLTILPAEEIIIAEGILLFAFPELVSRFDYRIFRAAPEQLRFDRRLERDVVERRRSPESVLRQFETSVAPMHNRFVEPSAAEAHRVVESDEDLGEVVDELVSAVQSSLV